MIIDLFYFNNELDLLEIRLNILDKYVDKFVLVEARETFSGVPKPLYYEENKERFARWNIIHYVVENGDKEVEKMALLSPNTGAGEHFWLREFYQKEMAQKALLFCEDNDIVYISDVDEIWRHESMPEIKDAIYKPRQLPYLYFLNQRTNENWLGWTGTICTRYKNIKGACMNHLRTDDMNEYEVVERGGWHFNSIGGKEKKKNAFKHPVYENDTEWQRREVEMHISDVDWPEYLSYNRDKYKQLCK